MTRYYVDISTDLLEGDYALEFPEGFRLVERWGPRDLFMERWLVEDDGAPEDFEGHLVSPVFFRDDDGTVTVNHREKVSLRY